MKQPSPSSRWIGRILRDKWRIDRRIARGGMGTVYAATHRNNGSSVAIKVLHPEHSRDEDTKSRFLQEGYAANQVNHPGVVRVIDDDTTEEGLTFLVMELLEGELLEQCRIRKGGKLPWTEVHDWADQLLDVLAAAHAKGVVHRDIKPENIFVTTEGRLKVLDFGFARLKSGSTREPTATGFLLGTPGFMAPEQAIGNRGMIDAQTDLWAVGATLFILLSGHPVHEGESAAELLVAAANFPVRSIATLEPGLPVQWQAIVDRALAFEKRDRFPDARSMQNALRAISRTPTTAGPVETENQATYSAPEERSSATISIAGDEPTLMEHLPAGLVAGLREVPFNREAPPSESTIVMDGRPLPPGGFQSGPRPSVPAAIHRPPHPHPMARTPRADDARLVAPPARGSVRDVSSGSSRVLSFLVVAVITMVIVVVTGLLVVLGSD